MNKSISNDQTINGIKNFVRLKKISFYTNYKITKNDCIGMFFS